jgi:flagellar motor switch protein FliG
MHNFEEILLLDDIAFKNILSEIDSADIVCFLKNCDNNIKNDYL